MMNIFDFPLCLYQLIGDFLLIPPSLIDHDTGGVSQVRQNRYLCIQSWKNFLSTSKNDYLQNTIRKECDFFPLNRFYSKYYLVDESFRNRVLSKMNNKRRQLCLHLLEDNLQSIKEEEAEILSNVFELDISHSALTTVQFLHDIEILRLSSRERMEIYELRNVRKLHLYENAFLRDSAAFFVDPLPDCIELYSDTLPEVSGMYFPNLMSLRVRLDVDKRNSHPNQFQSLMNLKHLAVLGPMNNQHLPISLEKLVVHGTVDEKCMQVLPNLKSFIVYDNIFRRPVPISRITRFPSEFLGQLEELKFFSAGEWYPDLFPQFSPKMKKLAGVSLRGKDEDSSSCSPSSFKEQFPNLKSFKIANSNARIRDVAPEYYSFPNLMSLDLSCSGIVDASVFGHVPTLNLSSCHSLTKIDGLGRGNVDVNLEGCSNLKDDFSMLSNVRRLNLSSTHVSDLSGLSEVPELILRNCVDLKDFSPLGEQTLLVLDQNNHLTTEDLHYLSNVRYLSISNCRSITDLKPLTNVYVLIAASCPALLDVNLMGNFFSVDFSLNNHIRSIIVYGTISYLISSSHIPIQSVGKVEHVQQTCFGLNPFGILFSSGLGLAYVPTTPSYSLFAPAHMQ